MGRGVVLALCVLLLAACTGGDRDDRDGGDTGFGEAGSDLRSAAQPGEAPRRLIAGWTVTVYYTPVARFHAGPTVPVTGCRSIDCAGGDDPLGEHPETFVAAVREEGTGRTADGRYLNWSHDTGYWLDTAPRDASGRALRAWTSAAADRDVMAEGTRFTVVDCGKDNEGFAIDAPVCARLRAARWTVTDEFTPGLGGPRHVDLYLGEQTGPNFTANPLYISLYGASLSVG
ncbi:MAG TPA: hypothetical protein VES42_23520 [Pilimelia sp.]|nr:hypothetical protein [Pilimelia sp.]